MSVSTEKVILFLMEKPFAPDVVEKMTRLCSDSGIKVLILKKYTQNELSSTLGQGVDGVILR